MCGRFTLRTPSNLLVQQFLLDADPQLKPRYNVAPTQPVPVVRVSPDDPLRRLTLVGWGLIPSWAKDASIAGRMINARSETVATKPAFRSAFRRRRCLVVADGYYEWQKVGGKKQPYYIRRQDGRPFAFGGLWDQWRGASEEEIVEPLDTCTIITTESNELTRAIHDRMPVILDQSDYELWLDPQVQDPKSLQPLLRSYASGEMIADPVSTYVNRPANDDPRCVEVRRDLH